jgi:hypothetical protein
MSGRERSLPDASVFSIHAERGPPDSLSSFVLGHPVA